MRAAHRRTARSRERATGLAARRFGSCGHRVEHSPQRVSVMPFAEGEECLVAIPMRQITLQDTLDSARRIFRLQVRVNVAREPRVRTEAAADQNVVAIDCVTFLVDCYARGDQPDIADVMLRAGMVAAGEMDVHRRVERDARRLAPGGDLLGLLLGMRGGEAATGRAGA